MTDDNHNARDQPTQLLERMEDGEQDTTQKRPVFDGKTGEARTVKEARRIASSRVQEGERPPIMRPAPETDTDAMPAVYDGTTDEAVTVYQARRRAAARLAGMESGTAFLKEDVGKPIVKRGKVKDEYGTIVDVDKGCATIKIRPGIRKMAASAFEKRFSEVEELYAFEVYRLPPYSDWIKEIDEDAIVVEF
ncbi:hypothetical protein HT576_08695 [Haloterrigena sp. SYSU A121-1]|uniref:Uncharacterized protein n=1 Tax=Haloterrigena gelatinilytica TaxID=2741724 RepID=A0A8J8GNK2_9EURY|nr:hypothetical protein [Haloterrigena gelatinilytica]NUB91097.1 hypothetical protein [Haloterrigena gelatinilytica]